jgi:hypothetical protein
MKRIATSLALVGALALVACSSQSEEPAVQTYSQALATQCGGIAGFPCPAGQQCIIHDNYPDAMGVCVGRPAGSGPVDCSLVLCMAVACQDGWERIYTPNDCCGRCVPAKKSTSDEGRCQTVADCSDLPHIMCVGAWSCDAGYCAYTCDSDPVSL